MYTRRSRNVGNLSNQKNRTLAVYVAAVMIALGIAVFFYRGKPTLENALASKNWPTVSGVVKTSRVSGPVRGRYRFSNDLYRPEITFAYEVDGHPYVSSQIAANWNWYSDRSSDVLKTTRSYPVHAVVEVAYNPAEPTYAVLETGATRATYFLYYTGPGVAILGLLLIANVVCRRPANMSLDRM